MTRVSSIFGQMLQLLSHTEFERAVAEHRAERHARGFSCWGQFVAMLFCHLGRAQSLREICGGWPPAKASCAIWVCRARPNAPPCPTPTSTGPWQLYRTVFCQLLSRCREVAGLATCASHQSFPRT